MGEHDPFEKIRKYLEDQAKMPHVATNIAAKPVSWPGEAKVPEHPSRPVDATFPGAPPAPSAPPAPPAAPAPEAPAAPAPQAPASPAAAEADEDEADRA